MEFFGQIASDSPLLTCMDYSIDMESFYNTIHSVFDIKSITHFQTIIAKIATYKNTTHLFDNTFNTAANNDALIAFKLAAFLCLPDSILEEAARQCIATYLLTNTWNSNNFPAQLHQYIKNEWTSALNDIQNHIDYGLNERHFKLSQYVANPFAAGTNIYNIVYKHITPTLWDFIQPEYPTYEANDIITAILQLSNFYRKINIDIFHKYVPLIRQKAMTHNTDPNAHHPHCFCFTCMDEPIVAHFQDTSARGHTWSYEQTNDLEMNGYAHDDPVLAKMRYAMNYEHPLNDFERHVEWLEHWDSIEI
jgi:hypothetical protein